MELCYRINLIVFSAYDTFNYSAFQLILMLRVTVYWNYGFLSISFIILPAFTLPPILAYLSAYRDVDLTGYSQESHFISK